VTLKTRKARFTLCVAVASVLGAVFSSSAQGAFAFSNGATITIPAGAPGDDGPGNANPYPSSINVSGLLGTVGKATVTLTNLTHTWPDDIDILLSGPGGQAVILMSDAGTSLDVNNVTLTFDDAAGSSLPNEPRSSPAPSRPPTTSEMTLSAWTLSLLVRHPPARRSGSSPGPTPTGPGTSGCGTTKDTSYSRMSAPSVVGR
jgi:hypothetical protein